MKRFCKFLLIPLCLIFTFIITIDTNKNANAQTITSESDNIIVMPSLSYESSIGFDVVTTPSFIGWNYDENGYVDINIYVTNTNFNLTRYNFDFDSISTEVVLPFFTSNGVYWTNYTSDLVIIFNCIEEVFITYFESIDGIIIKNLVDSYVSYSFMVSTFSMNTPLFTLFYDLGNNYNPSTTRTYPIINPVRFGGLSNNDYQSAYDEGYDFGYQEGKAYAKDYYFDLGYQKGLNEVNPYTFYNLIGAVIDVPINAFKALLNFELFDVNLLDFVLSVLTFFLIIKVVGWFSGKA